MKIVNWLLVFVGICGLISVRVVEGALFYDPFLSFFKEANPSISFPDFEWFPLVLHHIFRWSLNVLFSLIIIQFLFKNKMWTAQAALLMLIFFVITFAVYLYCIYTQFEIGYVFSFYMRRFVIQPLVLLLIVPLFYYRMKINHNDE